MMMHAYQETYLSKAQKTIGEAFEYAIKDCGINGNEFINMFIQSDISKRMENGEPAVIAGKSGIEIAIDIIYETTGRDIDVQLKTHFTRTKEYWSGWAIAYYQWYSTRSYTEIFKVISYDDLLKMYRTLHEADISKFVEIVDKRVREYYEDTNLKRIRTIYGFSQSSLAKESNVSLRSIQMYEQRRKDINKASFEAVYRIAKVLGCNIEDLIEK